MDMSKEEVAAIMSLAKKILQEQDKKKDLVILRDSEDQHDMTGRPGPGNCECCQ